MSFPKLLSVLFAFCLFNFSLLATPVMFPLKSFFYGANYTRGITITAVRPWLTDGTSIYAGSFITLTPSGGTNPIVNLAPNDYTIALADVRTPLRFSVPETNVVMNVLTLISNGLSSYTPVTIGGTPVAAGFGLTSTPTGSVNTLAVDVNAVQGTSEFTIALLPDTQFAIQNLTNWVATMQWLEAQKPLVVIGLGDVVDDSSQLWQSTNALAGYNLLTCPVVVGAGNHDVSPGNVYTNFNTYFPRSFYTNTTWFNGGFAAPGEQQNMYLTLTNGSTRLLIISLAWAPDATQMQWASNVAAAFPSHRVILETHNYLMPDGHRSSCALGDIYTLCNGTDGVAIWASARQWPNLSMIVGGHQIGGITDETNTLAIGTHGNWVQQIFCDHQDNPVYAFSAVKLLTFKTDGTVRARTWDQFGQAFMPKYDYSFSLGAGVPVPTPVAGSNVTLTAIGDGQTYRIDVAPSSSITVSSNYVKLDKLLWLKFDDTNNFNTAADFSGWGRSVTGIVNSVSYGSRGRAMWGLTNTIAVLDPTDTFRTLTNFSTSFWFRMTNEPAYPALFVSRFNSGTIGSWFVGLSSSGTMRFSIVNTNASVRTNLDLTGLGSVLYDGRWHYVAATFDGSKMNISVDARYSLGGPWTQGIQDYNAGLWINGTANPWWPSLQVTNTVFPTGALIDEVKIWGRGLSDEEVHADFESAGAELTPLPAGVVTNGGAATLTTVTATSVAANIAGSSGYNSTNLAGRITQDPLGNTTISSLNSTVILKVTTGNAGSYSIIQFENTGAGGKSFQLGMGGATAPFGPAQNTLYCINASNGKLAFSLNENAFSAAGTMTATNGITYQSLAVYAGPICTNGLAHQWNSNGIVLLRYSSPGATTWAEKTLAP